jgi:hypothetical protein
MIIPSHIKMTMKDGEVQVEGVTISQETRLRSSGFALRQGVLVAPDTMTTHLSLSHVLGEGW